MSKKREKIAPKNVEILLRGHNYRATSNPKADKTPLQAIHECLTWRNRFARHCKYS